MPATGYFNHPYSLWVYVISSTKQNTGVKQVIVWLMLAIIMIMLISSQNTTLSYSFKENLFQKSQFPLSRILESFDYMSWNAQTADDISIVAYSDVLSAFNTRINSLAASNIDNNLRDVDRRPGILVGQLPIGIAINPTTDRVYVVNSGSDTVSVINSTDQIEDTIKVGRYPYNVAVDPFTNRIYVLNHGSGSVSVINGLKNTIEANISGLYSPVGIAINPIKGWLYVTDIDIGTVEVIDLITNKVSEVVNSTYVGNEPYGITVNPKTGTVYATSLGSDSVSVMDASPNSTIIGNQVANITVGHSPAGIAVNPRTGLVYVADMGSDSVAVINETSHKVSANITTGKHPVGIAVDQDRNIIYVSNTYSNSVSVINGYSNKIIQTIKVHPNIPAVVGLDINDETVPAELHFPVAASYIAVNPFTKYVYVSHTGTDSVSVLDSSGLMVGVRFGVNPPNSGYIICGKITVPNNNGSNYFRTSYGATYECEAKPNNGFVLGSWSGNIATNFGNNPLINFKAIHYGNLTANFIQLAPPIQFTIPTQTLIQILLIIVTAVVGWLIPSIVGWINKHRQKYHIINLMNQINEASNNMDQLEKLKKEVSEKYVEGRISSLNYEILNKRISDLVESYHKEDDVNTDNSVNRSSDKR